MFMTHVKMKVYAAPVTNLVQVRTECSICAGSKEEVVDGNNKTTISGQGDGGDWGGSGTEFEWD